MPIKLRNRIKEDPLAIFPPLIIFTVKGRIPSKKNSRNIFVRGGKLFNIPSKEYAAWHKIASLDLKSLRDTYPNDKSIFLKHIVGIELEFYAPDKRASDLTNKAESIMDLLVDNEIIPDDNWYVLNKLHLYFMGVDKENPRCEIRIYYTLDDIS